MNRNSQEIAFPVTKQQFALDFRNSLQLTGLKIPFIHYGLSCQAMNFGTQTWLLIDTDTKYASEYNLLLTACWLILGASLLLKMTLKNIACFKRVKKTTKY